ncbi:hypothetical protein Acy02nite_83290 [Actinoplanes cyaneus]|uniref:Uncharacterized protein n=1 Tax=Actinoplanes cyaneus TaxID=52696 RepID=A0A919MAE7_9ACTN|nr:hypothetical protein [Actinoplanes cyaneus]GID70448.1 hypothetical protein Acy02nite_83290 [Actinoplanes cyaneus]
MIWTGQAGECGAQCVVLGGVVPAKAAASVTRYPLYQRPRAYFVWISVPATTEPVIGFCGASMTQSITRSSGQDSADG